MPFVRVGLCMCMQIITYWKSWCLHIIQWLLNEVWLCHCGLSVLKGSEASIKYRDVILLVSSLEIRRNVWIKYTLWKHAHVFLLNIVCDIINFPDMVCSAKQRYMYWLCTFYRKGPINENSFFTCVFQYHAFIHSQDMDHWNIYLQFRCQVRLGDSANKCARAKNKNRNKRNLCFDIELFNLPKHFNTSSFIFT